MASIYCYFKEGHNCCILNRLCSIGYLHFESLSGVAKHTANVVTQTYSKSFHPALYHTISLAFHLSSFTSVLNSSTETILIHLRQKQILDMYNNDHSSYFAHMLAAAPCPAMSTYTFDRPSNTTGHYICIYCKYQICTADIC